MRLPPHVVLLALAAAPLAPTAHAQTRPVAQPAAGPTLTLDEAITIARRNNPLFLQTANNRRVADAQVRSAYGAFLPGVQSSFSGSFQQGGTQYFNGVALSGSGDNLSSQYQLGVGMSINGATFLNPRAARANREATEADVTGAAEQLRATVTQQYLGVLRAQATAAVRDTLVATARAQLDLARTKVQVGTGTILDVRRAEVALGQSEVEALRAANTAEIELLRLFQQMGVPQPEGARLVTTFAVEEPRFQLDSLLGLARRVNPALEATRSREHAAGVMVKARRSQYTPTLSLSTGWGGQSFEYTNPAFLVDRSRAQSVQAVQSCETQNVIFRNNGLPIQDCSRLAFSDATADRIRSDNNAFPFRFERAPMGFSATLRLPIFDNFNREAAVEQAKVDQEDARYAVRARELQLSSDVTQAHLDLRTAARTVVLQEQNAAKAREELSFAEERYRVGAATFLDVITSRGTFTQAQIDRVNAIYDYHRAFAALENAVGRPLR